MAHGGQLRATDPRKNPADEITRGNRGRRMRRLLLDTHTLLWWLADDPRLGPRARELIGDERNEACVSATTAWEISIKNGAGQTCGA